MRKEGWKEIWFKKKKKFPRVQNPKSTMTLTDDANIIVAKSKNSILYTRHVPLTYTIANRANRFSMLRFEPGWPTWMTTSSTFINLFFFLLLLPLINVLLGRISTLEYRVSSLRETWEKGKQFFVYFTRWQLHKSYLLLAVNW